jgi:hypothetical protein
MAFDRTIYSISLVPAKTKLNKWTVIFKNKENKKIKKVSFGSKGYRDYTLINDKESDFYIDDKAKRDKVKDLYIIRHKKREDWTKPDNKGSLSRWILWNLPTIEASLQDYKKRFNLKGGMGNF